jgi:hypothetical protein
MQTSNLLLLSLATFGLAFDVTLWQNPGCTGKSRHLNVFDNTCAIPGGDGWSAVTVNAYGAGRQRAGFYSISACIPGSPNFVDWWADGGSDTFLKGRCIKMETSGGTAFVANAASSYLG